MCWLAIAMPAKRTGSRLRFIGTCGNRKHRQLFWENDDVCPRGRERQEGPLRILPNMRNNCSKASGREVTRLHLRGQRVRRHPRTQGGRRDVYRCCSTLGATWMRVGATRAFRRRFEESYDRTNAFTPRSREPSKVSVQNLSTPRRAQLP